MIYCVRSVLNSSLLLPRCCSLALLAYCPRSFSLACPKGCTNFGLAVIEIAMGGSYREVHGTISHRLIPIAGNPKILKNFRVLESYSQNHVVTS